MTPQHISHAMTLCGLLTNLFYLYYIMFTFGNFLVVAAISSGRLLPVMQAAVTYMQYH